LFVIITYQGEGKKKRGNFELKKEGITLYSRVEEAPQDASKEDEREGVGQEELDADGPPEEAEVGGVTTELVDAVGDEAVVYLLGGVR
jgi:hypothetical protein